MRRSLFLSIASRKKKALPLPVDWFDASDGADFNNSAASGGDVWTNKGLGNNARRHGSDPQQVWQDAATTGLGIAGVYHDGATSKRLLVETDFVPASMYSLFVVLTPDTGTVDPTTGSSLNTAICTSGASTGDNALFGIGQTRTALDNHRFLYAGASTSFDSSVGGTFVTCMNRQADNTVELFVNNDEDNSSPLSQTASPTLDQDAGQNVYAIGNDVDLPTGSTARGYLGWTHEIRIYDRTLTSEERDTIINELITKWGIS